MVSSLPKVAVWAPLSGSTWAKVGSIGGYTALNVEPRHLDAGPWSLDLPYDDQALAVTTDRLITFDWRGRRIMTGAVARFNPHADSETGQPVLTVAGLDAFTMLGRALAWPAPNLAIDSQPAFGLYSGPAETVCLAMIAGNLRNRYGAEIAVDSSAGRGSTIKARIDAFDNLLALVATKAKVGGIGINVGLVDTSSTRSELTVSAYVPVDRTLRVRLSAKVGTLRDWSQDETEPTATRALVGGPGDAPDNRVFRQVTTTDSVAAATAWGGHREVFVPGPDSFDNTELDQAGEEALTSGSTTANLALTAAEAEGLLAFTDYAPGDLATAEVLTGLSLADVITAIGVQVNDQGVTVTPTFGDPNRKSPNMSTAQLIRALRRRVNSLEARR